MNIFAIEEFPGDAARHLCDKHVIKMILESTQLLSTVAQMRGHVGPYKVTHAKHPCTLWTARHPANWAWLVKHASYMAYEYTDRYGKRHKCHDLIDELDERSPAIWAGTQFEDHSDYYSSHTPFEQCMPEQYKRSNPVEAYRAYYIGEKARFATWKLNKPSWFPEIQNV